MAPVCESYHYLDFLDGGKVEKAESSVQVVTRRWCDAILPKKSSIWPKNTSTYHRPPLTIRSATLDEHPHLQHRSEVNSGDNTTVVVGSVVGVVFIVIAFGLVTCCCMASRKKCGKKKPKEKDKDKPKKPTDDPPYRGYPAGTYQQVQDWINYHPVDYYPGMPQIPPFAYQGGLGGLGGIGRQPGNEMDAPQMGYGAGWAYR